MKRGEKRSYFFVTAKPLVVSHLTDEPKPRVFVATFLKRFFGCAAVRQSALFFGDH